jgi:tyrosine-protein phosphatase YwqE
MTVPAQSRTAATYASTSRIGVTEIITTPHVIQHVWDNTPEKIVSTKNMTILELQKKM